MPGAGESVWAGSCVIVPGESECMAAGERGAVVDGSVLDVPVITGSGGVVVVGMVGGWGVGP